MSKAGVSYKEIKKKHLQKPEVKKEYDALELRYSIVKALAKLRKEQNLTQLELADKMKTTPSVISRIESGNQNVSVDTIEKIAKVLGKTPVLSFK
ncbi:helix-turn-helix transcriptional regulator [Proteiniclasticum sp. SCR006]|uniref:Helix-turn-helix transcriptional regulator n=1 Tax=Proteiniclasticum aestuarii TaxID=2817862 RepID=A0A939KK93_9CLOT|nr:helix-turn-helix transcriptional regulator [Proteiniclasticum aestuarii]MBO1264495.1 helix-turn-helix transcriptional regulator [Proteiniclasticum aestuarii]